MPPTVVFACDDNYALPLTVAIRSMIERLSSAREISIYVIDAGLSPSSKQKLVESCPAPIRFLEPLKEELATIDGSISPHTGTSVFLRFQIPELLPKHDRVLYLDADLVVLDCIGLLWDLKLARGMALGAVADMVVTEGHAGMNTVPGWVSRKPYFNAGVLLLDLAEIRKSNIFKEAHSLNKRQNLLLADQDSLNAVCQGKWQPLPPQWNLQTSFIASLWGRNAPWNVTTQHGYTEEEQIRALEKPSIVHFTGLEKPWHLDGHRYPTSAQWREIAHETAWTRELPAYCREQTERRILQNIKGIMEQMGSSDIKVNVPEFAKDLIAKLASTITNESY